MSDLTWLRRVSRLVVFSLILIPDAAWAQQQETADWPMYNRDVSGTRHNPGETAINSQNAVQLVEKWRFPSAESNLQIGVIHATPIVVNGYVYFGTATDPTFYKIAPDGKVRWKYRNSDRGLVSVATSLASVVSPNAKFQSAAEGFHGSALVTADTVYFADIGGWIYALDRASGVERWKINTRKDGFPDAHPMNCLFASPILADGKIICGGGTVAEQLISGTMFYRGSTGRGFVVALDPKDGHVIWKYNVGPKPAPLDPPITLEDSWGKHTFYFGPATSSVWSTPSFDAESNTIFFGTDVNTAPRRP